MRCIRQQDVAVTVRQLLGKEKDKKIKKSKMLNVLLSVKAKLAYNYDLLLL